MNQQVDTHGGEHPATTGDTPTPTTAQLQSTLATVAQLLKKQNKRIEALEEALEEALATRASRRYADSRKENRTIHEDARLVALCARLLHVEQVPARILYASGVLSQSKVQGLMGWDPQHLADYLELNGVTGIYERGLSTEEARALTPHYDELKAHIRERKKRLADIEARKNKPSRLDKALARVNEQYARRINYNV